MAILQLGEWEENGALVRIPSDSNRDPISQGLSTDEKVVLDLHASGDFERNNRWYNSDSFDIRPGECIRIRTEEELDFSTGVMGLVLSRVSLAADGLVIASVKIDPLFQGRPEIAVANSSRRPIKVAAGSSFASVAAITLLTPLPDGRRRTVAPTKSLATSKWKSQVRAAGPFVLTGVVTFIAAAAPEIVRLFS